MEHGSQRGKGKHAALKSNVDFHSAFTCFITLKDFKIQVPILKWEE